MCINAFSGRINGGASSGAGGAIAGAGGATAGAGGAAASAGGAADGGVGAPAGGMRTWTGSFIHMSHPRLLGGRIGLGARSIISESSSELS